MESEIKPNICPYCEAAYTLAAGGCAAKCRLSQYVANLVAAAADADMGEDNECHEN